MFKNRALTLMFGIIATFELMAQDTIEVSKGYKTVLIFPKRISESIIGNDLTFNVDLPKRDGSKYGGRIAKLFYNDLSKERNDRTNYTVITEDGNSYDYILKQVERPKKMTWYIKEKSATVNLEGKKTSDMLGERIALETESADPELRESKKHPYGFGEGSRASDKVLKDLTKDKDTSQAELYRTDRDEYFRKRCYYHQFDKPGLIRHLARSGRVYLQLNNVYYDRNELYFFLELRNKESIDYDVNFVRFSIATDYKRSSSNQTTEIVPLYTYKVPSRVEGRQSNHFVMVFEKFSLDDKKVVLVELNEINGNRNIDLFIDNKVINESIKF